MSVQTLYTAATGMDALQTKLDVIAHNLANVNTTGFKKNRANFEDLFYRNEMLPGAQDSAGNRTGTGTSIGLGTRVASVQTDFLQGTILKTGNSLDVAIVGTGFFQVKDPNGQILYTRAGNFSVNPDGNLVMGSASIGRLLEPTINIPRDAIRVEIKPNGEVVYYLSNSQQVQVAGQIQLATFANPEGLIKLGDNLYQQSDSSGTPNIGNPLDPGFGELRSGFLEASNVDPVNELIDLITTQRSFELNSEAVKTGDQILQLISNLRRP